MQAAIAHRKWVDIAHYLGCHAIRCNMGGPRQDWKQDADLTSRSAESFNNLLEYARQADLNILIENHGGASSDADVVVKLIKAVDNPHFGTLRDFGNINPGDDNAEVIRKIVPYAKGISVKTAWAGRWHASLVGPGKDYPHLPGLRLSWLLGHRIELWVEGRAPVPGPGAAARRACPRTRSGKTN